MNKLISTIQNIWKIKELRDRILFTFGVLFIYVASTHVVLPGVDPAALKAFLNKGSGADLLGLINQFTGGAFNKASVMALGIMPYISASIVIQLLGFAVPYFQRLQQHEGESGRKKLNQITRMLTVAITLVQGGAYLTYLRSIPGAIDAGLPIGLFWVCNIVILSAGTIFAMWLGERITDKGIGNGASMIIMLGILISFPLSLIGEFQLRLSSGPFIFIFEIAGLFLVIMLTVLLVQGVRKIPIQFAKRVVGRTGTTTGSPQAGTRDYIPLKVNAAGVMPIIFAQALMFLPATVAQYFGQGTDMASSRIMQQLLNPFSFTSSMIAFILVVVFTYIYTALIVNPQQYSEYLKRQNAFIPGVKPGKSTADFIDAITSRITLPGAVFLGFITILPAFVVMFGVASTFAAFFGGTSMLIIVGVILDTLQQIDSHLLMRKYDGLVKSGKLQGRATGSGLPSLGAGY
jgi:preprotein translocase subunit SecY